MKYKLISVAIKFALIGAMMNIIALITLFYIGKHPLLLNPFLDARWPLYGLFIFFSIKVFRDENDGVLHFWQGLMLGFLVYVIMAQLAAAFVGIFGSFESTHFLSTYISTAVEQINTNKEALLESNIDQKTLTDALELLPRTTAGNLAFDYLLKSTPIGLILTLLLSIIMRRN
jgi:uncharacterized protein DUF4199